MLFTGELSFKNTYRVKVKEREKDALNGDHKRPGMAINVEQNRL